MGYTVFMNRSGMRSQKRKELVEAVVLGNEPVALVARNFKVSLRTAFDWLSRYRQGGWPALNEVARSGRPRKIGGDDMTWLYAAITMQSPLNYEIPFSLWSLNSIRTLLHKERGVLLSKSSLCRLMSHLCLTPQRHLYLSYKQAPDKIRTFLDETYPAVVSLAKKQRACFYFLEEAPLGSDVHQGTTGGKCEETPSVYDGCGCFGYTLISGVSVRGDMHFEVIEACMNAEVLIEFLKKLYHDAGHPVFLIADKARYCQRVKIQEFLETQLGKIMMVFLPANFPEPNQQ